MRLTVPCSRSKGMRLKRGQARHRCAQVVEVVELMEVVEVVEVVMSAALRRRQRMGLQGCDEARANGEVTRPNFYSSK